jgi:hypothetical protein
MKNVVLIIIVFFIVSCSNAPVKQINKAIDIPKKGTIFVENGMHQMIQINYLLYYALDSLGTIKMDTTYFKKIICEATAYAKSKCDIVPSFEPYEIAILPQKKFNPDSTLRMDTIQVIVKYRGKNNLGTPGEFEAYPKFIGMRQVK